MTNLKQAFPNYDPLKNEVYFKCVGPDDPTYDHIIGGRGAYIDVEKMKIIMPHKNEQVSIKQYTKISAYSIDKPFKFGQKEL